MPLNATITLQRLLCFRETDGSGHSEPYLWPVAISIDDESLATPELVRTSNSPLGDARIVLKNDMKAGEIAPIPFPLRWLPTQFEDGQTFTKLILAVALWEEDSAPLRAVQEGYRAFERELGRAIADNLLELSTAQGSDLDALVATIRVRVRDAVRSAVSQHLTSVQKVRVALGALNMDDLVGSAFLAFGELTSQLFRLGFGNGDDEFYVLEGSLFVQEAPDLLCRAQAQSVAAALDRVKQIQHEIEGLAQVSAAPAPHAMFDAPTLRHLKEVELEAALRVLARARRALRLCQEGAQPGGNAGVSAASDRIAAATAPEPAC